jgi:phytoene dehydrogenase-like protein
MRHDDLPHELRIKWDTYNLDIVVMEGQRAPLRRTIVRRFQSARTRALFAGLAAHSFLSLDEPVSGAFGMLMAVPAHAVGWPIPRGGLLNTHAATQKPCPHK